MTLCEIFYGEENSIERVCLTFETDSSTIKILFLRFPDGIKIDFFDTVFFLFFTNVFKSRK